MATVPNPNNVLNTLRTNHKTSDAAGGPSACAVERLVDAVCCGGAGGAAAAGRPSACAAGRLVDAVRCGCGPSAAGGGRRRVEPGAGLELHGLELHGLELPPEQSDRRQLSDERERQRAANRRRRSWEDIG